MTGVASSDIDEEARVTSQEVPHVPQPIGGVEAHGGSREWGRDTAFVPMASRMGRG